MLCLYAEGHNANCRILFIIIQNIIMLIGIMLIVLMLSVIMLSVIMLSTMVLISKNCTCVELWTL